MLQVIFLAVSLSWDSFFVGIADGAFCLTGGSRLRLLLLFALCDSCGTLFGMWGADWALPGHATISGALTLGASLLILCAIIWRSVGKAVKRLVYFAPLMLCFDNVVFGSAALRTGVPPLLCIAIVGAVSGVLFSLGVLTGVIAAHGFARGLSYSSLNLVRARGSVTDKDLQHAAWDVYA
jgi:hypothetical protein